MMDDDRIWRLMANKLSGEASEQELEEFEELLKAHPELSYQYKSISNFWNSKTIKNGEAATKAFQKVISRLCCPKIS